PFDFINRSYFLDFSYNIGIMWGNNLSPIFPIHFITIIFFWVMGGGDHNTTLTGKMPYGKGKHGCRPHFPEIFNLYSVGGQNMGCSISKKPIVNPTVMGHGYLYFLIGKAGQ